MKGINGAGGAKQAQLHQNQNSHSRRPGTAGHPGKHLGQFKDMLMKPELSGMPVIQQQISALNSDSGQAAKKADAVVQNNIQPQQVTAGDPNYQLALDALRDTNNSISDQLRFTSRFNALTTYF